MPDITLDPLAELHAWLEQQVVDWRGLHPARADAYATMLRRVEKLRAEQAAAQPTPATDARTEFGWLLETGTGPAYWCGEEGAVTYDARKAIRFARRQDADQIRTHFCSRPQEWRVVEHGWTAPATDARTQPKETDMNKTATVSIRHETRTAVTSGTVTVQYLDDRHLELELQALRDLGLSADEQAGRSVTSSQQALTLAALDVLREAFAGDLDQAIAHLTSEVSALRTVDDYA